jgi:hypothetical protein
MRMKVFHCACAKINPFDVKLHSCGVANSLRLIPNRKKVWTLEKRYPFQLKSQLFGPKSQLLI